MTECVYLLAGVVVGFISYPAIGYAYRQASGWKLRRNEPKVDISDETPVICGACRSHVLTPPYTGIVTKDGAFRVYRCQQCGTNLTVPA